MCLIYVFFASSCTQIILIYVQANDAERRHFLCIKAISFPLCSSFRLYAPSLNERIFLKLLSATYAPIFQIKSLRPFPRPMLLSQRYVSMSVYPCTECQANSTNSQTSVGMTALALRIASYLL